MDMLLYKRSMIWTSLYKFIVICESIFMEMLIVIIVEMVNVYLNMLPYHHIIPWIGNLMKTLTCTYRNSLEGLYKLEQENNYLKLLMQKADHTSAQITHNINNRVWRPSQLHRQNSSYITGESMINSYVKEAMCQSLSNNLKIAKKVPAIVHQSHL